MFLDESSYPLVPKGWGHEIWVVNTEDYCGKRFFLRNGKRCSWHYHREKDETIMVLSGRVKFEFGSGDDLQSAAVFEAGPGEAVRLTPGVRHRFTGLEDSHLIEFSTQHKDEDSIRVIRGD